MNKNFEGKRTLVCGGTDGIGKASALLMAERGAEIIIMARNQKKLKNVCDELSTSSGQTHTSICADFNDMVALKKSLSDQLKGPIHILINNSGGPHGGELIHAKEEEFRIAFERLLIANQVITQAIVPMMKEHENGRIINIISTSVNQVIPGLGVSNTIRGAVTQWAKTLALELGDYGITVNNILPGYTATRRLKELSEAKAIERGVTSEEIELQWANSTSLKRLGNPSEIASAVAFIASNEASYINGFNMSVDGGRYGS